MAFDKDKAREELNGAETETERSEDEIADDEDYDTDENTENEIVDEKRELLWLCISTIAAAAAIIACGFLIGRFAVPVSSDAVTAKTAELFRTDADYLAAVKESKEINDEIDSLNADNERIENSFNDVVEYEKQLDKLKADFKVANDKLYDAQSALKSAKTAYDNTQSSLTRLRSRTVTLSPGTYTVGVHIPTGAYLATGNGSFLTAGSDKILKINVNLDRNPFTCELAENDTIKLSCEAKFQPVEE